MPGFEVVGNEEFEELQDLFNRSKVLFRHSFDHLRNGVYKVREFEKAFAEYISTYDSLAVTSGTAALKIALKSLGIGKGDEVITQSFTFVATVEAIIESGAQPVIAEIDDSLNMDPNDLEKTISDKTKAIIAVHMLGVPAKMDNIMKIAKRHNIFVIEDTAWGCGGKLNNKYLGNISDVGVYSFDFNKTITTGEGGMIVAKDKKVLDRAKAYHDHGHENNPDLQRWEDSRSGSGFNYRMNEMQGAVGLAQLKKLSFVIEGQRKSKNKIMNEIKDIKGISFRSCPSNAEETADALIFSVEDKNKALACRNELLKNGLGTKMLPEAISWHFAGLWDHMHELKQRYGNLSEAFPMSKHFLDRSVAIPIYIYMNEDVPQRVKKSIISALE